MRSALALFSCLAVLTQPMFGQDSSAFADASPTPYPPVYPVVVQPAQLPPAIVVQTLSINTVAALPPEQLSLAVQSASQSALLAIVSNALASPVSLVTILQKASAPAKATILAVITSVPSQAIQFVTSLSNLGALSASLSEVSSADLYSLLQAVSQSPTTAQLFLNALSVPQSIEVTNAIITHLSQLSVLDTEANNTEVMLALAQFATLDSRFPKIGDWSFYGKQLADVRAQIAASPTGMTPELKAQMLSIINNAANALRAFKAQTSQNNN